MNATRQFKLNKKTQQTATERLSSGFRINRAADDAAGLAISEKMRAQIRGLDQGTRNVQDGISFCNVADGALNEVHAVLGRIRELAVKAASDTYVEEDRRAIEDEFSKLKQEIDRISRTTEFNTKRIFDDGVFKVEFSDDICPIKIFNATHGSPTASSTYGGIIVGDDERIPWNAIDPAMVSTDPNTGETLFRAGEYEYQTPDYNFTITCDEGTKPPEIKIEFEVSAGGDGIRVAGDFIFWEDVVNDNDECILDHLGEEGYYHFRNRDGAGSFYVEAGAMLSDIIKALNEYNDRTHTRYYSVYDGYYSTQAVDVVDAGTTAKLTQDIYDRCFKQPGDVDLGIRLQADRDGIWAVDKDNNELTGSKKSWASLGLADWNSGKQVSDTKKYTYSYQHPDMLTNIKFDFFLLDETSKDSVIEGINNMTLEDWGYYGNSTTSFSVGPTGNIVSGKLTSQNNTFSVMEQGEFGRDFDTQTDTFAVADLIYDNDSNSLSAVLESTSGTGKTVDYKTTSLTNAATIENASANALHYLTAKAVQATLTGAPAYNNILDVIGADHITDTGYLSETYTTSADTIKTSNLKDPIGTKYPAASIDFSGLGVDYELYDLLGTGFDSTCMTCNNHYSVLFTYGDSTKKTSQGYGFSSSLVGNDYTLHIDLKTLMEKGINTGEDFTKALVEIFDDSNARFDSHFTQYATDASGKLYICDNRPNYVGTNTVQKATFYVAPYNVKTVTINTTLKQADGSRTVSLSYEYDVSSLLASDVHAAMEEAADGLYIKNADNKWELFNADNFYETDGTLKPGITALPTRYNIVTSNTIDWEQTYDTIMQEIAGQPGFSVQSADYAYLRCTTNENPNDAYVSTFRFQKEEDKDDGMWIQAGANQFQGLFLKWDGFSSHTLGLSYLSMTDGDEAGKLITRADHAIGKISRIRSAFGAYTNRMEHIMNMNSNYAENLQAAESSLRDTDMAKEIVTHSKANILAQATQAMLSQSIRQPEGILQLLQ